MGPATFDQCYPGSPLFLPDEFGNGYKVYMVQERRDFRVLGIRIRALDSLVLKGDDTGTPMRKVLYRFNFGKYGVVG